MNTVSAKYQEWVPWIVAIYVIMVMMSGLARPAAALSISDEKKLGRKVFDKIKDQMELVTDGEAVAYVQSVGDRVVARLGPVPFEYKFFIVNEPVPNAFAIPGGYVFIYRGMIDMLENEGELASIISHEISHVSARHIHERLKKQRVLQLATVVGILASAFLGVRGDASQAMARGTMAAAATYNLSYSREQEREADQLGFHLHCDAGYDPRDIVGMMNKMVRARYFRSTGGLSYLSTHPAMGERIKYVEVMVQKEMRSHPGRSYRGPEGDFKLMQAALVSDHADMKEAMSILSEWELDKARIPAAVYGLGRLYMRKGQMDKALDYLHRAAEMKPDSAMVMSSLGYAYYQQGRTMDAQRTLKTALVLEPTASIAHFRLAMVMKDLGQADEALYHLQQAERLAPLLPELDYHLGVLYGQMNMLGLAHFHLGRYNKERREWDLARFHFEKARPLLEDSPIKVEEIDDFLEEVREGKKARLIKKARQK